MSFDAAVAFTFTEEGGYSEEDGIPTNFGITLPTLHEWRSAPVTAGDVEALTQAEAGAIYRFRYWNPYRCWGMPGGIDALVFDMLVNPGPTWTTKTVQYVVGAEVDGFMGPKTCEAVARFGRRDLIAALSALRREHYTTRPGFARFGRDWLARTDRCRAFALLGVTG